MRRDGRSTFLVENNLTHLDEDCRARGCSNQGTFFVRFDYGAIHLVCREHRDGLIGSDHVVSISAENDS